MSIRNPQIPLEIKWIFKRNWAISQGYILPELRIEMILSTIKWEKDQKYDRLDIARNPKLPIFSRFSRTFRAFRSFRRLGFGELSLRAQSVFSSNNGYTCEVPI